MVVTHQLQVERRGTGKVRRPAGTDVPPLCHATNSSAPPSGQNNELRGYIKIRVWSFAIQRASVTLSAGFDAEQRKQTGRVYTPADTALLLA